MLGVGAAVASAGVDDMRRARNDKQQTNVTKFILFLWRGRKHTLHSTPVTQNARQNTEALTILARHAQYSI